MAQAILADTFPPEKRGLAFALYGVTAVVGPVLGPTLGGWITDKNEAAGAAVAAALTADGVWWLG
jgi:DHA2 family multidrug resistance protein